MSRTAPRKTVVQLLFDDPKAIDDNEIKVWVKAEHPDDRLFEGVDEYIDALPYEQVPHLLIPADDALELAPGQPLLFLQGSRGYCRRSDFVVVPPEWPFLDFPNGRLMRAFGRSHHNGMYLGDQRHLRTAGRRALEETGNADWMGGIADFATRFLRRPVRSAKGSG